MLESDPEQPEPRDDVDDEDDDDDDDDDEDEEDEETETHLRRLLLVAEREIAAIFGSQANLKSTGASSTSVGSNEASSISRSSGTTMSSGGIEVDCLVGAGDGCRSVWQRERGPSS